MRPVTFVPEEIIAAGKALQAEGVVNITGFALRKRVGGGDPSRLRQVWDGYLAGQTSVEPEPLADLPPELADAVKTVTATLTGHVVQLLRELNDRAVRAAECRVDDITRTAEEQKAQAERELADAVQTVDDLEQKLDAATADLRKTLELLDGSREREQTYLVELAQVRERLTATEERLKDAEKNGREAAEQHRQQTETLQHKLDDAEQRLTDSVSRYTSDLREAKVEYSATVSELKAQYMQREESLLTRADSAENAAREAQTSEALLQGEIRALKEQNRELTALLYGSVSGLPGNADIPEADDAGVKASSVVTPASSRQKKERP
ncbi:DNA-binding protein [Salmonella enterica]|uniref:DNA-binding protein n=1 Tax=Salmonella sp. SAL04162 TaxID=3159782 RepID=UPI002A1F7997|nr:DNA-binding protein [Salmonella enterica]